MSSMLGVVAVLFLTPLSVLAHGFGARIDLPVPFSTYLIAAGAAVVLSFVVLGIVSEGQVKRKKPYPQYDLLRLRPVQLLAHPFVIEVIRFLFLAITLFVAYAGITGFQSSAANIAPTALWIIFGVGMVYVSAFIGNVWVLINPAHTLAHYTSKILRYVGVQESSQRWSASVGIWPAFFGFFFYRWLENVYPSSGHPDAIGYLIVLYLIVSVAGSLWVGKKEWFSRADPFNVFFGFLSRFAITRYEQKETPQLFLRFPAVGLFDGTTVKSISEVVFVIFMLSSVAFDGVASTSIWAGIVTPFLDMGVPAVLLWSVGIVALLLIFLAAYSSVMWVVRLMAGGHADLPLLARTFVLSLLPIAIGYEVAHFISLLLVNGQSIIPLISDPLGKGWNLFGTASYAIDYSILNLKSLWNWQMILIVTGHVIAVWISHLDSLRFFPNGRQAIMSQIPMLVLMVGYTVFSLWLLALPIVVGLE